MVIDIDQYPAQPKLNFEDFFKNYEDTPNHFKYREEIQSAALRKKTYINVLFEDILQYDPPLAELLREAPEETLREGIEAFKDLLKFYVGGQINEELDYFIRIKTDNNSNEVNLRKLRAVHIDKLVYIYGILIRASQIIPQITVAYFECPVCQQVTKVDQIETALIVPKQCSNCKNKSGFMVTSKDSKFIDWQSIRIQELPEELTPGRVPYSIKGILTHDLVDKARPGDRVKITGIYKTFVNENRRGKKSTLFTPYLKILSIEGRNAEDEELNISPEDEKEFRRLAAKPNIQDLIAKSIAPSILGMEHLKMAAALSLFGGVRKELKDGSTRRGDIHILFVGDPGTGKSMILKQCAHISPQAIYTSGKGSSAAGLTAAVVRENDASGLSLEAGALVLADGGNAIIDEFDKMDNRDRVAIHEAMEQQSYHPKTEILTTSGERICIGIYVDDLMKNSPENIIYGNNCEIFTTNDLGIYSSDFQNTFKTTIDRVSRHLAPKKFYKFQFSNGRSVQVTPEHPMYVHTEKGIKTIPAEDCSKGMYIPAPSFIPNSSAILGLKENMSSPKPNTKEVVTPRVLSGNLARILGYHITEGHSYKGSTAEIGFSNLNNQLIQEVRSLYQSEFNIRPSKSVRESDNLITLRYLSIELYKWFQLNFHEVMTTARNKRIPSIIMKSSNEISQNFLQTAFKGDGSVESTSICYRTSSQGLSHDYQDLLLKLGIKSRIVHDKHNDSYKVYIRGHNLSKFFNLIVEKDDRRLEKIEKIVKKSVETNRHDTLPNSVIPTILKLKKKLGVPNDGYFYKHLKKGHGITRSTFRNNLKVIYHKWNEVNSELANPNNSITSIREKSGLSQYQLAEICDIPRSSIDYYERGGYDTSKRVQINSQFISKMRNYLKEIEKEIDFLNKFEQGNVFWETITKIEEIPNSGENFTRWVYDVTVEPNHTFISQGVILHNTVSVAKAGIIATLRARTSIIAAANPKMGRYSIHDTPTENINLSPPILSRFDLIFVVRDEPNETMDKEIADFILELNTTESFADTGTNAEPLIPSELLQKYIKFARNKVFPKLSPDARKIIRDFYVELRKENQQDKNAAVAVVARNLEGYIRMAEAYARMALRNIVTKDDAEKARKLARKSLEDTSIDPITGKLDADRILTGISTASRQMFSYLDAIKEKIDANGGKPIDEEEFITDFEFKNEVERSKIEKFLMKLKEEGTIFSPSIGKINLAPESKRKKK